ncbi:MULTISPECIES: hypothetical protein [Gordonia]|uniref:Uncharacterized protein n=1 Tax=Gordonia amicalis TaxID=89053 RepID=A0AAE4UC08_9ACTN|nr:MULTISPECIES: hypothetical protein [Gordonia]MDV6314117.1 hypothetical protein [Gordonia amicalis]
MAGYHVHITVDPAYATADSRVTTTNARDFSSSSIPLLCTAIRT